MTFLFPFIDKKKKTNLIYLLDTLFGRDERNTKNENEEKIERLTLFLWM